MDSDRSAARLDHSSLRGRVLPQAFACDSVSRFDVVGGMFREGRPDEALIRSLARYPEAAIWGGNYFADLLPASAGWLVWRKPQAETGFSLADVELCWTSKPFSARTITAGRRDGNLHPTQKPVGVMKWTLGFIDARIILDPFMGSGTTGVAAIQLGRKFIGIERVESYFDIACRRVSEALRQPDMFIESPRAARGERPAELDLTTGRP